MQERHIALLVEDDPELAKQIAFTFKIIGHDFVHVTNQEDAIGKLSTQKFCYVLMDLQIKATADAVTAEAMAGHELIRHIIESIPAPTSRNKEILQTIVMSGHAKDHDNVRKAFQLGANDFLTKPLSANVPAIDDRIREALVRSGRAEHSNCLLKIAQAKPTPAVVTPIRLTINGSLKEARTVVTLDGKPLALQNATLQVLLRLVRGRVEGAEWVSIKGSDGFGEKANRAHQNLSRLRREFEAFLPEAAENDRGGGYRLNPKIQVESLDVAAFKVHPSLEVQQEVRKIVEASKRHGRSISDTKTGD